MWDESKNGHRMWDDRNFNGKMKKLQVERASEDKRKQRLQWFHTAFQKPDTLVTE